MLYAISYQDGYVGLRPVSFFVVYCSSALGTNGRRISKKLSKQKNVPKMNIKPLLGKLHAMIDKEVL